ncbi:AAA family ATPase [Angustibacter sp. McL0619]|uniref:helix-turn-helix transcriptional regulator n=1 Tax=Angustibacter sp. McL0619 TaxID=3415676 RepID=UPI003CF7C1BE
MVVTPHAGALLGRQRERPVLERLMDSARDGHGGVLVVHGDPGVGKTALLQYAVEAGNGFRVVRTAGVEGEMELDYAVLQQLCAPLLEFAEHLPDPQRDSLAVAFGLSAGPAPSPFLVGLATLGLISEAAEQQPLLCIVDDAQWLDGASARALAFVARRLLAERIALAFATRDVGAGLARFPRLRVDPLGHRDARALLESVLAARLDESVLERIIAETGGNPLALLELPRGLTPTQLAGGFGLPAAMPLSNGIEQSYTRRLTRLPRDARRLLLLAAAEPVGDPALLWRAAEQLEIPDFAVQALESEGLLTVDGAVAFRHPLVRSAVYGTAEPTERRSVHRALADATDPQIDPDRRAWHRAQAAFMPDEQVARELEDSAVRAQARGGLAAAAAFLERAAALTPEPAHRVQRALVAAHTKFLAGALEEALVLLSSADVGALDELGQARVELLRAQIAFASTHGSDAPTLLLAAARRLTPLSPALASETYLEALSAALFSGRLGTPGARAIDVAVAAASAPKPAVLRAPDLLLEGLTTFLCEGYVASAPSLRRAQDAFDVSGMAVNEQLRWKWLVSISSVHLWDDVRWLAISERHVQIARETGALAELPLALSQRVFGHLFAGELTQAASLVDEIRSATDATGATLAPYGEVGLVALRGREPEALWLIEQGRRDATRRGEGIGLSVLDWAQAVLYNGLGRYVEAREAATRALEYPHDLGGPINWGMVEHIEAAARAGTPELAVDICSRLTAMAEASGTDWARGLAARSEALLADDHRAEELFLEALDRLGRTRMAVDLARTHLLYGEWLRRDRRRLDARGQLRTAHDLFSDFGMEAFAERARLELAATGEHARKRAVGMRADLTPQEMQIARLARDGLSNADIGARLYISKHTVEYHLRKVFAKLEINSRTKLALMLPPEPGAALTP